MAETQTVFVPNATLIAAAPFDEEPAADESGEDEFSDDVLV